MTLPRTTDWIPRIAMALGLLILHAPAAHASEPGTSLEEQLRFAAAHHPGVQAAYQAALAAGARVAKEKGWPDPVFSYGYYIEPVETAVGPQRHRFSLSQRIPWFGKLSARGSAAEQAALAAESEYTAAQLRLFERVADAHYEYAYLGEAIRVTEESLQLLINQEEVARARYRTQTASYSELMKAQVELGILEDRLRTLRDRRRPAAARLRETLGLDPTAPQEITVSLEALPFTEPDPELVVDAIRTRNPELQGLDHRIAAVSSREDVARREGLPDFTVGVQTILTSPSDLTAFEGQGKDAWIATFSLRLPLWRGQYEGAEAAELAQRRSLEHRHREREIELEASAEEVLYELRDAQRRIELYGGSLLPKARQSVDASVTAFRTGKAGFLDFIDAQRTLLQFQLDLARARADYGKRIVALTSVLGEPPVEIPQPGSQEESQ